MHTVLLSREDQQKPKTRVQGLDYWRLANGTICHQFKSSFGVSLRYCEFIWLYLESKVFKIEPGQQMIHLLWTQNLLKTDCTEHQMNGHFRANKKTIQKLSHESYPNDVTTQLGLHWILDAGERYIA